MNIHTEEMISVLLFLAVSFTVTAALVLRTGKEYPGGGRWICGTAFASISFVLIALRPAIPEWISIVIGNTMSICGGVLIVEGNRLFVGLRARLPALYLAAAVCLAVLLWFDFGIPNTGIRIIAMSLFMSGFGALSAVTLWRGIPSECKFGRQWTGSAFAVFSLGYLARAVLVWGSSGPVDLFGDKASNPVLMGLLTVSMLAWCAGFYLLSHERHKAESASPGPLPTTSKWCYTSTDAAGPSLHRNAPTL